MAEKKSYSVPAVEKALDVLEYLKNNSQAALTQIHQDLQLPKSTTYGILQTLESRGYIRKDESNGYCLGLKLYELGVISVEGTDLIKEALPIMEDLARNTGFVCNLGVMEGDMGVYIEKVEPPSPVRLNSWKGKTIPLHCTSLGKVLLAYKGLDQILEVLNRIKLTKNTEKSIIDKELLLSEILQVKQKGYAIDDEENEPDITCFAAPIFDHKGEVVAAVSLSGLTTWSNGKREYLIEQLIAGVKAISKKLGYN
ncbi:MAG: IclR family transcriptional regulator [Peptococcales bacterium]|jgi:IclR family KDG regulon transcriptional repressor